MLLLSEERKPDLPQNPSLFEKKVPSSAKNRLVKNSQSRRIKGAFFVAFKLKFGE